MGIKMYQDGLFVKWSSSRNAATNSPGDGRVVVGRHYTAWNQNYGSVDLDELLLFKTNLTEEEIGMLSAHV